MGIMPHKLLLIDASSRCVLIAEGPCGKILAEIPLPKGLSPLDMVVISDSNRAIISLGAGKTSGALRVLNLNTFSFDDYDPAIPYPAQMSAHGDGTRLFLTDPEGCLYRLDQYDPTPTSLGNPGGDGRCTGLASNSDYLYGVWETASGGMLMILDHEGQTRQKYPIGGIPTGLTLDQQGRIFVPFTASPFSGEGVFMLSASPAVIILNCCHTAATSRSYPLHVAVDPAGKTAYVTCEDNATIAVIDIPTAKLIATIAIGRSVSRLALLPDGKIAVASSNMFADLSLIDLINARLISFTADERQLLSPLAVIQ